jgi:lysophospholipase L1-like esterase
VLKAIAVKLPKVKIILTGPLPTGNKVTDDYRRKYQLVHQQTQQFVNNRNIFFSDPSGSLIDAGSGNLADGCYRPDGIHLTDKGYTAWVGALQPVIKQVLGK